MKMSLVILLVCGSIATFVPATWSQPPDGPPDRPREAGPPARFRGSPPHDAASARGPHPLLELLDADHDGTLTSEEMEASASVLLKCDRDGDGTLTSAELGPRPDGARSTRGRGGPPGPPPGEEGPPGPGAGPHAPPNPPALGDVLPPHVRHHLRLNDTQTAELEKLQSEVKDRLTSILDAEQLASVEKLLLERPGPPPGPPEDGPPRRGRRGHAGPPR